MIKNNLKFINKKFSEKLLLSFNKISSSAKKSAVMCLFIEKNNKIYLILTKRSEKLNQHAGEIVFQYSDRIAQFMGSEYPIKPYEGLMFLFPSKLKHYVPPYWVDAERISVSGNFVVI